ncbi:MAG TPA: methyltransferase domain-containing protein [Chthoniobacterales bacterium]|nr:methyltransferase domain-containing protein [Chthoniobacterales bacterium]
MSQSAPEKSNEAAPFSGSVPENYDRFLGPMLFQPYAADLVERISVLDDGAVLEIACGTGIVTRRLRDCLSPSTKLVASDLNEAMMDFARKKFRATEGVEWRQADAAALPFAAETFDAVICQFGLMFVPEKGAAMRETKRVLKPNGAFVFNVWDSLAHNEFTRIAHETVGQFFDDDPPAFYHIPFGYHDRAAIRAELQEAGFRDVQMTELALTSRSLSAAAAARGLVEGSPIVVAIVKRDAAALPRVRDAVADVLRSRFGDGAIQGQMRALVFAARA